MVRDLTKPLIKMGTGCSLTVIRPGQTYRDPESKKDEKYTSFALRIDLVKNKNPMKFTYDQWASVCEMFRMPDVQEALKGWEE